MKSSQSTTYYIENLTVDAWVLSVLPYFLRDHRKASQQAQEIYYFDNSKLGLWLANFTLWFLNKRLKRADFSQGDTRDRDGNLVWMKTMKDALSIQNDIQNNSEFQRATESCPGTNSLRLFLSKWAMCSDLVEIDVFLVLKFVFLVRSVEHQENLNNHIESSEQRVFLFMQERPWFAEIAKFVKSKGIDIIPTSNFALHFNIFLLKFSSLIIFMKELCKKTAYYAMVIQYQLRASLLPRANKVSEAGEAIMNDGKKFSKCESRLAVEYYGSLNLDSPEMFSDLFFLQKTALCPRDILIYFSLPQAPITDTKLNEIRKHGISAVAVNPRAAGTPQVPLFNHKPRKIRAGWTNDETRGKEGGLFSNKWLSRHILDYYRRYNYWVDFIKQCNIKVHVTWFRYSPDHCVILDAIKNTGGVGVVYERSFEGFPTFGIPTTADVVFGFSRWGAHVGRKDSMIPYYVIIGYCGDYRFGLLKERANNVRNLIQNHGAKKIVAYFDEHARNHPRWDLAYKVTLKNYSYLLNKVLENPWFGLILKPKVPATLRSGRLGPVSELLARAEKTGRCFIFEDSNLQSSYPPAVASLGADLAIHGHLMAATAGVESALTGTPTLLLDEEGTPHSPMHSLGERVVFKDIELLWKSCVEHWNRPGGVPGFGDWSSMLEELDPFRDGRAAERMGTYLGWLMEGFKAGLPREIVLADAAERYGKIWGKDKILSVNSNILEIKKDQSTFDNANDVALA